MSQVQVPQSGERWRRNIPKPRLADLTGHRRHDLPQEETGPALVTAATPEIVLFREDGQEKMPASHFLPLPEFLLMFSPEESQQSTQPGQPSATAPA